MTHQLKGRPARKVCCYTRFLITLDTPLVIFPSSPSAVPPPRERVARTCNGGIPAGLQAGENQCAHVGQVSPHMLCQTSFVWCTFVHTHTHTHVCLSWPVVSSCGILKHGNMAGHSRLVCGKLHIYICCTECHVSTTSLLCSPMLPNLES